MDQNGAQTTFVIASVANNTVLVRRGARVWWLSLRRAADRWPGAARRVITFFCLAKKSSQKKATLRHPRIPEKGESKRGAKAPSGPCGDRLTCRLASPRPLLPGLLRDAVSLAAALLSHRHAATQRSYQNRHHRYMLMHISLAVENKPDSNTHFGTMRAWRGCGVPVSQGGRVRWRPLPLGRPIALQMGRPPSPCALRRSRTEPVCCRPRASETAPVDPVTSTSGGGVGCAIGGNGRFDPTPAGAAGCWRGLLRLASLQRREVIVRPPEPRRRAGSGRHRVRPRRRNPPGAPACSL